MIRLPHDNKRLYLATYLTATLLGGSGVGAGVEVVVTVPAVMGKPTDAFSLLSTTNRYIF